MNAAKARSCEIVLDINLLRWQGDWQASHKWPKQRQLSHQYRPFLIKSCKFIHKLYSGMWTSFSQFIFFSLLALFAGIVVNRKERPLMRALKKRVHECVTVPRRECGAPMCALLETVWMYRNVSWFTVGLSAVPRAPLGVPLSPPARHRPTWSRYTEPTVRVNIRTLFSVVLWCSFSHSLLLPPVSHSTSAWYYRNKNYILLNSDMWQVALELNNWQAAAGSSVAWKVSRHRTHQSIANTRIILVVTLASSLVIKTTIWQ